MHCNKYFEERETERGREWEHMQQNQFDRHHYDRNGSTLTSPSIRFWWMYTLPQCEETL